MGRQNQIAAVKKAKKEKDASSKLDVDNHEGDVKAVKKKQKPVEALESFEPFSGEQKIRKINVEKVKKNQQKTKKSKKHHEKDENDMDVDESDDESVDDTDAAVQKDGAAAKGAIATTKQPRAKRGESQASLLAKKKIANSLIQRKMPFKKHVKRIHKSTTFLPHKLYKERALHVLQQYHELLLRRTLKLAVSFAAHSKRSTLNMYDLAKAITLSPNAPSSF